MKNTKTMKTYSITQLMDMLDNYILANDTGKFNANVKQAKQQLATLKQVYYIYGDASLSIETNNKTVVNNGSLYEALVKFIIINDNSLTYFHSAINKADVGRFTMKQADKTITKTLGLKRSANYEIKTSMRNESNDLKPADKRIIYITYGGAYLLNKSDIETLRQDTSNFKKDTWRLKANLKVGVRLDLLSDLLAL